MRYDRNIVITIGNNRKSTNWQPLALLLSEFYEKLRVPSRSTETMQTYLSLKKSEQDDLKDIGGFVAGSLQGVRRKAGAVTGRDLITLDFDNIPAGGTDEIIKRSSALGCGYCIYSTRKHTPAQPRLRLLFPLSRTASADEYEPVARYMAEKVGIEFADPTTFEAVRMMYWPSCCADSEYVFACEDKALLDVDGVLEQMGDWRDISRWPQVPGAENTYRKLATRQSDPLSKAGIIGAFCRTYDIYGAMDAYLPGIYEPVIGTRERYTYLGGSTTGGAVIYDNGLFLYSHHATDPCSGRLVNAFDLVRLHKFGDRDDAADEKTPPNRLPSYLAMCELAVADANVSKLIARERAESAVNDFGKLTEAETVAQGPEDTDWASRLELNSQTGAIRSTIDNIWLILENDLNLRGRFALNEFTGRGEVLGDLPWSPFEKRRGLTTIIRASTGTLRRSTRSLATAKSTGPSRSTARSTSSTMCGITWRPCTGTAFPGWTPCLSTTWARLIPPMSGRSRGRRSRRRWPAPWSRGASMMSCSSSPGPRASVRVRCWTR